MAADLQEGSGGVEECLDWSWRHASEFRLKGR